MCTIHSLFFNLAEKLFSTKIKIIHSKSKTGILKIDFGTVQLRSWLNGNLYNQTNYFLPETCMVRTTVYHEWWYTVILNLNEHVLRVEGDQIGEFINAYNVKQVKEVSIPQSSNLARGWSCALV